MTAYSNSSKEVKNTIFILVQLYLFEGGPQHWQWQMIDMGVYWGPGERKKRVDDFAS